MNKAPAFQQYAQDWLVGTAHLSLEAQGAYERLLCHQWVDGPLDPGPDLLRRLLGLPRAAFNRLWPSIAPHFPALPDGRLANPRLEFERDKQAGYRMVQSVKGQASAQARFNRGVTGAPQKRQPKPNLSFSSSPSPRLTDIPTESRQEGRSSGPQRISSLLGEANSKGHLPPAFGTPGPNMGQETP
jgi:uncharacterized protein YdaU (DUF1376 family)